MRLILNFIHTYTHTHTQAMTYTNNFVGFELHNNKAGNTATPVACGRAGLYLRSLNHLGRSSEAEDNKNHKKSKV